MSGVHRSTIYVEDATVIQQLEFPGEQFILKLKAPKCAAHAMPGTFAHVRCDTDIPMRRPLSIMRANSEDGTVEFLYKKGGLGLLALSRAKAGDTINILGPIGNGFSIRADRPVQLMIGGGVGIPPMVLFAEHLSRTPGDGCRPVVFMGSEIPFPFNLGKSELPLRGIAPDVSASMPLLEEIGVPCRLASLQGYDGCYPGFVTELTREWLTAQAADTHNDIEIFACGPERMLHAASQLAREFGIPSQLCLEEFMACAVGGCAGCSVAVHSDDGVAMKRVCVDGPVFDGDSIYPE